MKRIAYACEKAGTKYEFKKLKSGFVVCFYRSPEDDALDNSKNATDKVQNATDKMQDATDKSKKATDKIMSERRNRVMKHVEENGFVTNAIVREILCLEEGAAKRVITSLTKTGVLVPIGEKRNRKYIVPAE